MTLCSENVYSAQLQKCLNTDKASTRTFYWLNDPISSGGIFFISETATYIKETYDNVRSLFYPII